MRLTLAAKGTHVELTRETGESRLSIDRREDMKCKLLGTFDNDVVTGRVPSNHMVILGLLEQSSGKGNACQGGITASVRQALQARG